MEDSRTFLNYVHSPDYMFKFDMKSGYHQVSIHQESQTFLGFQWPLGSFSPCSRRSLVGALRARIIEFSDPSGIFDDSHLGFSTTFSACGFRAPVIVIYLDAGSRV